MKFVLAVFLCLLPALNALAQTEENKVNSAVGVEEIALARGDGSSSGKSAETTDRFLATDVPIFCFIRLDSEQPATVKMILIAVKAAGLRAESKIVTVSYTTKENQSQVNFTASPNGIWAAGDYRVDVYVNGKLSKSRTLIVEKSFAAMEKQLVRVALKSRATHKTVKRTRKN